MSIATRRTRRRPRSVSAMTGVAPILSRPLVDTAATAWGRRLRSRLRRRVALRKLTALTSAVLGVVFFAVGSPHGATAVRSTTVEQSRSEVLARDDRVGSIDAGLVASGSGSLGLAIGELAVALERPLASPPLEPGDIVELVALVADDRQGASANRLGRARVVAVDERSITVAIATDSAWPLLEYRAIGTIEAVLMPDRIPAPSP